MHAAAWPERGVRRERRLPERRCPSAQRRWTPRRRTCAPASAPARAPSSRYRGCAPGCAPASMLRWRRRLDVCTGHTAPMPLRMQVPIITESLRTMCRRASASKGQARALGLRFGVSSTAGVGPLQKPAPLAAPLLFRQAGGGAAATRPARQARRGRAQAYGAQAVVVSIDPRRVWVADPADTPRPATATADFGPHGEAYCWWQVQPALRLRALWLGGQLHPDIPCHADVLPCPPCHQTLLDCTCGRLFDGWGRPGSGMGVLLGVGALPPRAPRALRRAHRAPTRARRAVHRARRARGPRHRRGGAGARGGGAGRRRDPAQLHRHRRPVRGAPCSAPCPEPCPPGLRPGHAWPQWPGSTSPPTVSLLACSAACCPWERHASRPWSLRIQNAHRESGKALLLCLRLQ